MNKPLRISLSGPSGTGKTTLAKYISETYDIPFIETSTKPLWEKYGISSHQELIKLGATDPTWGLEFQYEVLRFRAKQIDGVESFVCDRSPLDNLAYFLLQNTHLLSERETDNYIKACNEALLSFNGLICLPFTKLIPLEDDGKRVANKYFQMGVNEMFSLASGLLGSRLSTIYGLTILEWDFEIRKQKVDNLVNMIRNSNEEQQ